MAPDPVAVERRTLLTSAWGCLIIGVVGVCAALISRSQAILLDGLFNLTYFLAGLFTLRVASLLQKGDDERFPFGYTFFEPLVNGIKGLLVLGISLAALIDSLHALLGDGRQISPQVAIYYGSFATIACWTLALLTYRGLKKSHSPLVRADAINWLVNGTISSAVLLAFLSILILKDGPYADLVPYLDPMLVLVVVTISIAVPIRMAWQAAMALLNRTPSQDILKQAFHAVEESLRALPVKKLFVRVIQPGRTRLVLAHVLLPGDYLATLEQQDALRQQTLDRLRSDFPDLVLELIFIADPKWGAPASPAAESSPATRT